MTKNLSNMNYGDMGKTIDIQRTWDEYHSDAFEMFDVDGLSVEDIKEALGDTVALAYSTWIYYHQK